MCVHTPGLGIVLQGLQSCLHQIQRLEEECRAGAAEGATHKGFESWVSLRTTTDIKRDDEDQQRDEEKEGWEKTNERTSEEVT